MDDATPGQLKKFAEDNRHFSLVRCAAWRASRENPALLSTSDAGNLWWLV